MKKSQVLKAVNVLAKIAVSKITDKEVKYTLVDDYLALRKASDEIDKEHEILASKFREDHKDELAVVQSLREKGVPVVGYDKYLADEKDLIDCLNKKDGEEIDILLVPVSRKAFLEAIGDAEIGFEDIVALGVILN